MFTDGYLPYRLPMDPCFAGALRLAAAQNDVCILQLLADGAAKFHVDANFEGFTALHAAAVQGSTGKHGVAWILACHEMKLTCRYRNCTLACVSAMLAAAR